MARRFNRLRSRCHKGMHRRLWGWAASMNVRQKVVITLGFVIILATGLYPPWMQSWDFVAGGEDVQFRIGPGAEGYSWIFNPLGVPSWVDQSFPSIEGGKFAEDETIGGKEVSGPPVKRLLQSVRTSGAWRARVDTSRLLIVWSVVAAGVLAGFAVFASRKWEA
jgi:hypothetical protein